MNKPDGFFARHRNMLLATLLLVTLAASSLANQERLAKEASTVVLPVVETTAKPVSKLEQFRTQRDETSLNDMAALQALVDQTSLDDQTRAQAAAQLQSLIDVRQKQLALEGALLESGIYPCVAVVSQRNVTIVTEKETLSNGETALLLTMARTHADADPSSVRVITSEK